MCLHHHTDIHTNISSIISTCKHALIIAKSFSSQCNVLAIDVNINVHIITSVVTLIIVHGRALAPCGRMYLLQLSKSLYFLPLQQCKKKKGEFISIFIFSSSSMHLSIHYTRCRGKEGADVFTAIIPIYDPYSRSFNFYLHLST